jgi:hypothetical protein
VTLGDGEQLGNMSGPAEIFVPVDGANREFADIIERKLAIEPAPPMATPS